ncbi:probable protein phosphatase 2C 62 isoform X2 [Gossypium raimondii]|uniref:probable protein phosphatase 2C 62 isoform X2 n=1 Tax=Gossypium raimondii TaxID=29730 RepID=UPI00227CF320|nr:probable protein phosphatase 2C 62 isoform X2 [Gossypium raimondii]
MAADPFFFASLEARSMSFPSCNNSLFWRFRFPPLHFHTLRFSPPKLKFNHQFVVSKCSSSDSVSADVDILSATEHSDGSVIFRFGNASEMAIIEDQTQTTDESAKVVAKDGGKDLDKVDKSSIKAVGVSDGDAAAVEPMKKKVGRNFQVKSQPKRKLRRNATKVTEVVKEKPASVVSDDRMVEKKSVDSSKNINTKDQPDELGDVVKGENNVVPKENGECISKTEGSSKLNVALDQELVHHVEMVSTPLTASVVESETTTLLGSPELGSEVEVPHGVKLQETNKGGSEGSGENDGKTEDTALNMVSKMDLAPDIEKVSPPLGASDIGSEITTELAPSESGLESEVPHSVKLEEEENAGAEENGEGFGKIECTILNTESKIALVLDTEKASLPLEVSAIESEITTELAPSESSSKSEVPHGVKLEEDENAGAEEKGEGIGKIECTILNTESKMALVPDTEKASPPLEAFAIESEITTELAPSGSSSKSKVPQSVKLEKEENTGAEEEGEGIGKIECTILNTESKIALVADTEKASPPLEASAIESEITTELAPFESGSKSEDPQSVKLEEEEDTSAEEKGERIGKFECTTSNMESKMALVPDLEKASPPLEAPASGSETRTELASLELSSKSEVPHSVKLEEEENSGAGENGERIGKIEGITLNMEPKMDLAVEEESGKDDAGEEVAQKSVSSKEHSNEQSINASKMLVMIEDATEGEVGEIKLNSTLSEVESILNEATVHTTMNQSVDSDIVKSSNMLDEGVAFSISQAEITEADAQSDNKVRQLTMLKGVELQSGGTLEREEISTAGFFLYSGAALLPNPTKAFAGGEDAYFIACQNWLGVADGVGQWSFEGISVGVYAKELMENCERIVSDRNGVPITDPVEILNRAAANTQSCGSSTVLVAYFDDQALHVANIGDSGFMIIRNGAVFKRSSPMVYELAFPVQIARGDQPSDFVEVYKVDLYEKDVIITATDGLFDNLYERDIVSIVSKSLQESLRPQEIAELLATRAQEVGQLSLVRSPFSDEVQAAGYVGYRGGKLDDVTVIVSLVKRRFSNHAQYFDLDYRHRACWPANNMEIFEK